MVSKGGSLYTISIEDIFNYFLTQKLFLSSFSYRLAQTVVLRNAKSFNMLTLATFYIKPQG
jgi:hypothetical protein